MCSESLKTVGQSWEYKRRQTYTALPKKAKKDDLVPLDIHNTGSTSREPPSIFPSWKTTNVEESIMISVAAHFGL